MTGVKDFIRRLFDARNMTGKFDLLVLKSAYKVVVQLYQVVAGLQRRVRHEILQLQR